MRFTESLRSSYCFHGTHSMRQPKSESSSPHWTCGPRTILWVSFSLRNGGNVVIIIIIIIIIIKHYSWTINHQSSIIGLSLVALALCFFDDQSWSREEIRSLLPQVVCVDHGRHVGFIRNDPPRDTVTNQSRALMWVFGDECHPEIGHFPAIHPREVLQELTFSNGVHHKNQPLHGKSGP